VEGRGRFKHKVLKLWVFAKKLYLNQRAQVENGLGFLAQPQISAQEGAYPASSISPVTRASTAAARGLPKIELE
jgi:hypothetical protein